jgi:O-antigen/teichoic acid export membrane protein
MGRYTASPFSGLRRMLDLSGFSLVGKWATVRRWAVKGGWAVLDQGLFSGANFLVNILLARWLPPEEYGAFAVALSVFYLLAGFHTAVLTEPMMVFGAGKYRAHFRKYLGMLLWGHWAISVLIALVLGGAALVMARLGSAAMAQALAGLAISSPFLLLLWLARRAPYVEMRPGWAVLGSGVNLLVTLGGLFLLWRLGPLSSLTSLVLLGASGAVASFVLLLHIGPEMAGFVGRPTPGMVLRDHRDYGSWNILAFIAYWASGQILMLLIPIFLGLAASAAVAATWNLYRPVSLFMQSLGLVILPTFSRWVDQGVPGLELRRRVSRLAFLLGGAVALYGLMLTLGAKPVLHLLYAGKYDNYSELIAWLGLIWVLAAGITIGQGLLRARGQTKNIFCIWATSSIFAFVAGVPALIYLGLRGAFLAFALSYTIALVLTWKFERKQ